MSKQSIFSHTQESYSEAMVALFGKGSQHAAKLYSEWFRKGHLDDIEKIVEPQAIPLMQKMVQATDFTLPEMSGCREEKETVKFLLKFSDGLEGESVLIPMGAGNTLCISSQVGCRMGCAFCETGKMGLIRHLTCEEIIAQIFWARFKLQKLVRNIVFMGMGEPFDNYEVVMRTVDVLTDTGGMGFGPSRITISTSGKVDAILRMACEADPALNLAVSVNAPTNEIRNKIMPINKQWDMAALKEAMLEYCVNPRREIFIEYVLLKGINDSLESADQLAEYLRGLRVKVNLIPYNPQTRDRFAPPEMEHRETFLKRMRNHGYQVLLRGTKGQQIMAACGQLGNLNIRRERMVRS